MSRTAMVRIREAILDQRYALTEHAYKEMDADNLDVLDVEAAILTGRLQEVLTDDPRGKRFVVHGKGCDQVTAIGVVTRLVEKNDVLVLTVYELRR